MSAYTVARAVMFGWNQAQLQHQNTGAVSVDTITRLWGQEAGLGAGGYVETHGAPLLEDLAGPTGIDEHETGED